MRHVREAVRFADGVTALRAAGVDTFVEVGPQSVLTAMAADVLLPGDGDVLAVAAQRRDRSEVSALLAALSELHVNGVAVTWPQWFAGNGARRVDLPTYAFQHQRYWPATGRPRVGNVSGAGLGDAEHPLLGAAVDLAGDDEVVLTGRLSLTTHPWLADHAVAGVTLLPGTALVELAVRAGDEVGLSRLRELTVATPLPVPQTGGVRIQVRVDGTAGSSQRAVTIYSRQDDDTETGWVRHADGVLEPVSVDEPVVGAWPPAGASEVDVAGWYEALAGNGLVYGPVFQGLRRAWTGDGEVYAEVALPEEPVDVSGFGVHPALLDAALHAIGLLDAEAGTAPRIPFAFEGVQVHASGAGALRVRLSRSGSGVRLVACDEAGAPVVSVDSLVLRELTGPAVPSAAARSLFEVRWQVEQAVLSPQASGMVLLTGHGRRELPADLAAQWEVPTYPDVASVLTVAEAGATPETLLLPILAAPGSHTDVPASVRAVAAEVLATVQAWLAAGVLADSKLVVVTRGAVAVRSGDRVTDLAGAAVWGLLRSAQSEHPGRVVLVDVDADADTDLRGLLGWAAGGASGGQAALRAGEVLVPRLVRAPVPVASESPVVGDGSVLVTGGTGALGALVAEHLVTAYGVRSLVLVSRQGRLRRARRRWWSGCRAWGRAPGWWAVT